MRLDVGGAVVVAAATVVVVVSGADSGLGGGWFNHGTLQSSPTCVDWLFPTVLLAVCERLCCSVADGHTWRLWPFDRGCNQWNLNSVPNFLRLLAETLPMLQSLLRTAGFIMHILAQFSPGI